MRNVFFSTEIKLFGYLIATTSGSRNNPLVKVQHLTLEGLFNAYSTNVQGSLKNLPYKNTLENNQFLFCLNNPIYCLTKISIRAKRSISRVFSLFIVPSPFFVHCPYKGRINRAESVLTGLKPY